MKPRPKGMDHIALKVTDMDASVRFYHDVLGMELVRRGGSNEEGRSSAVVQAGPHRFDLFYRRDFVSSDKDKPIGMDHVCLDLEPQPVEQLMDYLRDAGVEIFWAPVVRDKHTSVYVYDPDGVHVELRMETPAQ